MKIPEGLFLTLLTCLVLQVCGCVTVKERSTSASTLCRAGNTRVRRSILSWKTLRQRNVVMQSLDYSCGSAALATLMRFYFDDDVSETDILKNIMEALDEDQITLRQADGLSMLDLKHCAERMGYQSVGVRLKPELLPELRGPVLVHLKRYDYEHFAVLRGVRNGRVYLADPSWGNVRMTLPQFLDRWTDVALVLGKEGFGLPDTYPLAVVEGETVNDALLSPIRARYTLSSR